MGSLLQATTDAPTLQGELASLLQAVTALALVASLAYVSLRFLAGRGVGIGTGKLLQIEARLPLDTRSALLVVQVEGRRLLLATHTQAPPRLVAELTAQPGLRAPTQMDQPEPRELGPKAEERHLARAGAPCVPPQEPAPSEPEPCPPPSARPSERARW